MYFFFFFLMESPKTTMLKPELEQSLKFQVDLIWKNENF